MSTFLKPLLIYSHVLHVYFFYGQLRLLFVYHLKTTFYLPPRITSCLLLWTTSTYSPFQHISKDYIYHTHRLLIIMAKTHRTNPLSEEPTPRRSTRTAPRGKSPTARKKQSVSRKTNTSAAAANTSRKKNTSAAAANTHDDDTANTHDDDTSARKKAAPSKGLRTVFRGQRKSPPELIPLGPVPREAVVESLMPTRIPLVPARPR